MIQNVYADFLTVRATRPIAAGEEVFIPYVEDSDYLTRKKTLKGWFAECKCSRCLRDREVPPTRLQLRQKLGMVSFHIENIFTVESASLMRRKTFVAAAEEDLKRLRTAYTSEDKIQSEAAQLLIKRLGEFHWVCYNNTGQASHRVAATQAFCQGLEACGVQLRESDKFGTGSSNQSRLETSPRIAPRLALLALLRLALLEDWNQRRDASKAWLRAAETLHDTIFGPGLFQEMEKQTLGMLSF